METKIIVAMDKFSQIPKAANAVLSEKKYFLAFLLLSVAIFWILVLAPDKIVQSNAVLRILGPGEYTFLGIVAILTSLVITMQIFSFRLTRRMGMDHSLLSGAGFLSALSSAIFSSATCGLCVAAVFGFLGAGSVIFLVDNKVYVVAGSIVLLVLSLYFSSKKVNRDCDTCHV